LTYKYNRTALTTTARKKQECAVGGGNFFRYFFNPLLNKNEYHTSERKIKKQKIL